MVAWQETCAVTKGVVQEALKPFDLRLPSLRLVRGVRGKSRQRIVQIPDGMRFARFIYLFKVAVCIES